MSNKAINDEIYNFVSKLNRDEYPNIFAMLEESDITKNRVLETIGNKMIANKDAIIDNVVDEVELSFELI
jgi:hypothetical protein